MVPFAELQRHLKKRGLNKTVLKKNFKLDLKPELQSLNRMSARRLLQNNGRST